MHASYEEIARTAYRALDAGGGAPGVDEEVAHAIAWLEAAGMPGLTVLADALDLSSPEERCTGLEIPPETDAKAELLMRTRSCVFHAPQIIDYVLSCIPEQNSRMSVWTLRGARHALVLVAMAARLCPPQARFSISWPGGGTFDVSDRDVVQVDIPAGTLLRTAETTGATLRCHRGPGQDTLRSGRSFSARLQRSLEDGLEVNADAYARVSAYASKILVPETQTSRHTGAGAGLLDND